MEGISARCRQTGIAALTRVVDAEEPINEPGQDKEIRPWHTT
jgi:hypothetical protein